MGFPFRYFAIESEWRDETLRTNLWLIPRFSLKRSDLACCANRVACCETLIGLRAIPGRTFGPHQSTMATRTGEEHLLTGELNQLDRFTFAEHLRPTAPCVHVLTDPPHFTVAHLVYEAVVVDVWAAIGKRGR
jgi:hypothetical protein